MHATIVLLPYQPHVCNHCAVAISTTCVQPLCCCPINYACMQPLCCCPINCTRMQPLCCFPISCTCMQPLYCFPISCTCMQPSLCLYFRTYTPLCHDAFELQGIRLSQDSAPVEVDGGSIHIRPCDLSIPVIEATLTGARWISVWWGAQLLQAVEEGVVASLCPLAAAHIGGVVAASCGEAALHATGGTLVGRVVVAMDSYRDCVVCLH